MLKRVLASEYVFPSMIGYVATVRSCTGVTWCLIDMIQGAHLTDREDMLYRLNILLVYIFLPHFVGGELSPFIYSFHVSLPYPWE